MAQLAKRHQKIAAFTETGLEGIPQENWWTQMLLAHLNTAAAEKGIAYVLVWRNAFHASRAEHYYAPYPGQKSAKDFVAFSQNERMLFQNNLPKLYKKPKKAVSTKEAESPVLQIK
jgi:mannan endo-1,4-beta-mannosidase